MAGHVHAKAPPLEDHTGGPCHAPPAQAARRRSRSPAARESRLSGHAEPTALVDRRGRVFQDTLSAVLPPRPRVPGRDHVQVYFYHLSAWRSFSLLDAEGAVFGLKNLLVWFVMNWNSWTFFDIRLFDEQGREVHCAIDDAVALQGGEVFYAQVYDTVAIEDERGQPVEGLTDLRQTRCGASQPALM